MLADLPPEILLLIIEQLTKSIINNALDNGNPNYKNRSFYFHYLFPEGALTNAIFGGRRTNNKRTVSLYDNIKPFMSYVPYDEIDNIVINSIFTMHKTIRVYIKNELTQGLTKIFKDDMLIKYDEESYIQQYKFYKSMINEIHMCKNIIMIPVCTYGGRNLVKYMCSEFKIVKSDILNGNGHYTPYGVEDSYMYYAMLYQNKPAIIYLMLKYKIKRKQITRFPNIMYNNGINNWYKQLEVWALKNYDIDCVKRIKSLNLL